MYYYDLIKNTTVIYTQSPYEKKYCDNPLLLWAPGYSIGTENEKVIIIAKHKFLWVRLLFVYMVSGIH